MKSVKIKIFTNTFVESAKICHRKTQNKVYRYIDIQFSNNINIISFVRNHIHEKIYR